MHITARYKGQLVEAGDTENLLEVFEGESGVSR